MSAVASQPAVYLDYAATAPLCEEAARAMAPYFTFDPTGIGVNANANSLYNAGRAAFSALEEARKTIARCVGAKPHEIIFTSGATEADNAAVFGMVSAEVQRRRRAGSGNFTPRFITSSFEHHAILSPAKRLKQTGVEVVYLKPNRAGFIEPRALAEVLNERTVLVSIQLANSEIGAIQPVDTLARMTHEAGALFHTDATQALGKVPLDFHTLGVDAASVSAHKIGGPKGVGALYLRERTPFETQIVGGGQEAHRRSGTQNVPGVTGFAAALAAAVELQPHETVRLTALRDLVYAQLLAMPQVIPSVNVPAGSSDYLPNIVHVMVRGFESETLVLRLDNAGYCVSGGSACSAGSLDPSHVLTSLGIERDRAQGALRISMGRYTTESDIRGFLDACAKIIQPQRKTAQS